MGESGEGVISVLEKAEIQVPLVKTISQLEEIITKEDHGKLFLRWTPDISRERVAGYESRPLRRMDDPNQARSSVGHGGVSAYPLDSYPENGYGLSDQFSDPIGGKPRRYYLLRAEVLDKAASEAVLRAESIEPLAEIDKEAVNEAADRHLAYDVIRHRASNTAEIPKPGDQMGEVVAVMESWPPVEGRGQALNAKLNAARKRHIEAARQAVFKKDSLDQAA